MPIGVSKRQNNVISDYLRNKFPHEITPVSLRKSPIFTMKKTSI